MSATLRAAMPARMRFGECDICRQTHTLRRKGQPQKIRRKPFDVLLLLIDQRPQTLSHEQISRAVWGSKSVAAQHVARAVMEARREIGDDPESPRYILSVRGVGYRFAADVTLSAVAANGLPEEADLGASAARADIDAAAACLRRGDFEEAQRLVDRAVATADLAGARQELTRALALAASVVLRVGSREHALTLATKAVRLAQWEGRSDVHAEAQLSLAEVQLWMGSAHSALDNLLTVHRALAAQGPGFTLWRCERVLGDVYRELGRPEDAWPWSEQAQASALLLEPETRAIRERLFKVALLQMMIANADADGRQDVVCETALRGLALVDELAPDVSAVGTRSFELACRNYRSYLLEALGRLEEASVAIEELRTMLFAPGLTVTPMLGMRRQDFREVEAGLLSRSGRHVEALQVIEDNIAVAPNQAYSSLEQASMQALAARICERAGRYKDALEWMRRQLRSTTKLYADRAQATAGIVRAQLESDRLGEELAQARAEAQRLRELNQELERRIVQMDRNPLLDEDGLAPAAALAATIDGRATLARERDLPLCIGIVKYFDPTNEQADQGDLALKRRLKLLSGALKAVIPEASVAAQWRPGVCFFIISDMGLGPARQRCQMLVQRMNADMVPTTTPSPNVHFRADAVDVARFASIGLALEQCWALLTQHEAIELKPHIEDANAGIGT